MATRNPFGPLDVWAALRVTTSLVSPPGRWAIAAAVLAMASPALPQQLQSNEVFEDALTVLEVEVPVRVFVDGVPVRNLTETDFEVIYRGETCRVVGFEQTDLLPAQAPEKTERASRLNASARNLLLLFDFNYQSRGFMQRAVAGVERLQAESVPPSSTSYGPSPWKTPRSTTLPPRS